MHLRRLERKVIVGSRFLAGAAVIGALAGALLMFVLGLANIVEAYLDLLPPGEIDPEMAPSSRAVISVIESLDRFLIAIVLLYFSYGVYSLFIHPETSEEALALPAWLRIRQIGQLKQVVAEVIIVILFVLFLRHALHQFQVPRAALEWHQIASFLLLPVATLMLAGALRLLELHPKPSNLPPKTEPEASSDDRPSRSDAASADCESLLVENRDPSR